MISCTRACGLCVRGTTLSGFGRALDWRPSFGAASPSNSYRRNSTMAWSKSKKLNFINKEPVSRVATVDKRNRPQVTPVCHVVSGGKIYWASDFDAAKLANIKRHPWVSVVADEYRATWKNMGRSEEHT